MRAGSRRGSTAGDDGPRAAKADRSGALAADLARLDLHAETPYYAALRRYLALIGIEQGDAQRGRPVARRARQLLVALVRRSRGRACRRRRPDSPMRGRRNDGRLAGRRGAPGRGVRPQTDAACRQRRSPAPTPAWSARRSGSPTSSTSTPRSVAAFVRLRRLRPALAPPASASRCSRTSCACYAADDVALQRAYYAGIVGHQTGVAVAEAGYLASVSRAPFASAADLRATILGAMLVEVARAPTRRRAGGANARPRGCSATMAAASTRATPLPNSGMMRLDWRPVLRQIRTRLIGEMSGYGGPNITTRAGTRKV